MNPDIARNAEAIRARVRIAAERAQRDPTSVTIVAVSKTFDRALMDDAYELGFRVFGESRVQEIQQKCARPMPADAEIHMIGPLQTNKVRQVLPHIRVLETLDRLRLVDVLSRELDRTGDILQLLLQVNISGEAQKSGIQPDDASMLLDHVMQAPGLLPIGLMTMAPYGAPESTLRAVFGGLRQLRNTLQQSYGVQLPVLSMGMSEDFEIAIAEGATHIRIGRALFGSR